MYRSDEVFINVGLEEKVIMSEEKLTTWWRGILGKIGNRTIFTDKIVSATTESSAKIQFELKGFNVMEVVRVIEDESIYDHE